MVTGVLPYSAPSYSWRIEASIPTFQLFMVVDLHRIRPSRSRTFGLSICRESLAGFYPTASTSIVARCTIEPP